MDIGETFQDVIIRLLDYYDKGRNRKMFGDPFEIPKDETLELPDEGTDMINSRRANRNKMSQTKTTDDSGLSYRDAKDICKRLFRT